MEMAYSCDKVEAPRVSRPANFGLPVWYDLTQSSEKVESTRAGRRSASRGVL